MKRGRAKVVAAAVVHAAAAWAAVAAAVIIATAAARAAAGAGAGKLFLSTIIAAGSRVRREVPRRFACGVKSDRVARRYARAPNGLKLAEPSDGPCSAKKSKAYFGS